MEEKIKIIEQVIAWAGLSKEEVISYWQQKSNKEILNTETSPIINADFPADDIRSQTKLFWYAFEGKKFSPEPNAYPNCQGVVGWINPDPNAPEGDKIYVVLPEQKSLQYSTDYEETGADDLYDGRGNTKKLIEYEKEHNVSFPAAEFAFNYCKNGVKKGEAFGPAREQLKRVCANRDYIREALRWIGGTFEGWLWSSSEYDFSGAWYVGSILGYVSYGNKDDAYSVSCFLAY